jgi:GNAT superfamily N-acetyltransferase
VEPSQYQVTERLRDGNLINIRAISPNDRAGFEQAFAQFALSPDSVRFRFHGLRRSISETEAVNMTDVDFVNHVALVATFGTEPEEPLIGASRYFVCGGGPGHYRAEVAFAVLEEHQRKGIGSLLLRNLAIIGRSQGVYEFQAEVLANNQNMMTVLIRSGFPFKRSSELGVERVLLTIAD